MKKIIFSLALLLSLISPVLNGPALAEGETPSDRFELNVAIENPLGNKVEVKDLLADILKIVVEIALPVVILMVIYSGFMYVIARGRPEAIEKAHKTLTWTLIGAAILLGAQLIATVLVDTISNIAKDSGINDKSSYSSTTSGGTTTGATTGGTTSGSTTGGTTTGNTTGSTASGSTTGGSTGDNGNTTGSTISGTTGDSTAGNNSGTIVSGTNTGSTTGGAGVDPGTAKTTDTPIKTVDTKTPVTTTTSFGALTYEGDHAGDGWVTGNFTLTVTKSVTPDSGSVNLKCTSVASGKNVTATNNLPSSFTAKNYTFTGYISLNSKADTGEQNCTVTYKLKGKTYSSNLAKPKPYAYKTL